MASPPEINSAVANSVLVFMGASGFGYERAEALHLFKFLVGPAGEVFEVIGFPPFGRDLDQPFITGGRGRLIASRRGAETNPRVDIGLGAAGHLVGLLELLQRLRRLIQVVEAP